MVRARVANARHREKFEEETTDLNLNVYPNPTVETITVEVDLHDRTTIELKMYDLQGKNILQRGYGEQQGVFKMDVDVSALTSGIYILNIQMGTGIVASKKLIKHR